ncbi:MAG: hypothetical protein NXI20_16760 [bacterium]|nr:hypothetical protein [bacterium]
MQQSIIINVTVEELKGIIYDCINDQEFIQQGLADEKPMNQREAAEWLGVSEPTIIRYKKEGLVPFEQLPGSSKVKFYKSELKKAISHNRHLLQPSRK